MQWNFVPNGPETNLVFKHGRRQSSYEVLI